MRAPIPHRLTHLGVTAETPPSDAKYIIVTNFVALVAVVVSFFYLVVNLWFESQAWLQIAPPLLSAAVYGVPLWLNHRGAHWAATTSLCIVSLAIHLGFVFAFGYASGNHFFFLPILGGITLIYPPRHWKTAMVFVLAVLAAFIGIVLAGEEIPAVLEVGSETSAAYYSLALVMAGLLVAFISYFSHRRMVIAELQVEERSRQLAKALGELQAAQAQIIESENQAILGRLVAGLLHEINTPLGSVRSSADTLVKVMDRCRALVAEHAQGDDPGAQAALRAIEASPELSRSLRVSTDRISAVVESLRHFVGLDEAERKRLDVREGLEGALSLLGPLLGDRIRVVRTYPEKLPRVMGSPAKLNRVFLSVLGNAIQAIDGPGLIRVNVREAEGGVEVELIDDGRGIPASMMPRIFELGLTQKSGRVGMRLGLPMSKRSIEEMGGQFTLESVEGSGTTVRLSLPAALPT